MNKIAEAQRQILFSHQEMYLTHYNLHHEFCLINQGAWPFKENTPLDLKYFPQEHRTFRKSFIFILAFECPKSMASLVAQMVKNLPAMWDTQVQSLGWEDSLEKELATPLQYFCLENPLDRGA